MSRLTEPFLFQVAGSNDRAFLKYMQVCTVTLFQLDLEEDCELAACSPLGNGSAYTLPQESCGSS